MKTVEVDQFWPNIRKQLHNSSLGALEWIAIVMIHLACVPSTLAFINGLTSIMPSLDMILFLWSGLAVYLIKSFVENNRLMVITNAIAFFLQALLLALVIYK